MHKIITLDNGFRIILENISYVRSISCGLWVAAGSKTESVNNMGISHLIEHMLFKGTQTRSAKEIAEIIDNIGAQINAFTSKDCICFYIKSLDNYIDICIDVLADMFFNSVFAEKELNLEKKVILEEISMYEDTPDELVYDKLMESVWNGNPLSYPILGTEKSLGNIDAHEIQSYICDHFTATNSALSIVGHFDEEKLIALIQEKFSRFNKKITVSHCNLEPKFINSYSYIKKEIEQAHLCVGFSAFKHSDERIYDLSIINAILGGSMSSRLFQNIRENKGLVYSIFSHCIVYKDSGLFVIYAGMNPKNTNQVIELIHKEITNLKSNRISGNEIKTSKEQLKGNLILSLENTTSRMQTYGKSVVMNEKTRTLEEIIQEIDIINQKSIDECIYQVFEQNGDPAICMVSPVNNIVDAN